MLRDFVFSRAFEEAPTRRQDEQADLRFTLVASQLVGMAVARYIMHMEPLASLLDDEAMRLYGPTVHRYLTGDLSPEQDTHGRAG